MTMSKKTKITVSAVAAVAILAGITGGVVLYYNGQEHDKAVTTCQKVSADYKAKVTEYDKLLKNSKDAISITQEQVADPSTVSALAKDVKTRVVKLAACNTGDTTKKIIEAYKKNEKSLAKLTKVVKDTKNDVARVLKSKTAKDVQDATNNLKAKLDEANNKLGESNGKVADENTRTTLQNAINDAQKLYDDKSQNVDDLNNKAKALEDAVNAVNGSEQAKAQADAQAAAAAAAQAAQSKRSNRGYSAPKSNSGSGSSEPKSDSGSGALGPVWEGMTGEEWNRLYGTPCQGEACNTVL